MLSIPQFDRPQISVILVVYKAAVSVLDTVQSLISAATVPYELIIIDNDSPDGAGAAVRANVSGARFIWNRTNIGFGAAINVAVRSSHAEVLCLLNPDVLMPKGWDSGMLGTLRSTKASAVSPLILQEDGSVEAMRWIDAQGFTHPVTDDAGVDDMLTYCSAVTLMILKSHFLSIGGFDEQFFPAYFEDADLGLRLSQEYGAPVVNRHVTVRHKGGVSSSASSRQEFFDQNLCRFREKWESTLKESINRLECLKNLDREKKETREGVDAPLPR
jgi:O-antigen biosynthesis protein